MGNCVLILLTLSEDSSQEPDASELLEGETIANPGGYRGGTSHWGGGLATPCWWEEPPAADPVMDAAEQDAEAQECCQHQPHLLGQARNE